MNLVERMTISPATCFYCGCGNVAQPDSDEVGPFLDWVRDLGWGEALYTCMTCMDKAAAICGYVTAGQLEEKDDIIAQKNKEIHDLQAEYDSRIRRIKAVRMGAKAARQAKREKEEAAA